MRRGEGRVRRARPLRDRHAVDVAIAMGVPRLVLHAIVEPISSPRRPAGVFGLMERAALKNDPP